VQEQLEWSSPELEWLEWSSPELEQPERLCESQSNQSKTCCFADVTADLYITGHANYACGYISIALSLLRLDISLSQPLVLI
jgi:hypothetical protein